jgi:hypothetical protein
VTVGWNKGVMVRLEGVLSKSLLDKVLGVDVNMRVALGVVDIEVVGLSVWICLKWAVMMWLEHGGCCCRAISRAIGIITG